MAGTDSSLRVVTVGYVGPPGQPGAAGDSLVWNQAVVSDEWEIQHDLGYLPNVTIFDSADTEVEGDVIHVDINNLTVTFSAPFSGYAVLS